MKGYESYRESGVEWIGKIPQHWGLTKVKHLAEVLNGFAFKSQLFDNEVGFPILRIRDITSGIVNTYYKGEYSEQYLVNPDDLLIGMDGDFNVRWWDSVQALLNQRCCRIIENEKADRRYLYYYLPIVLQRINDLTYFTTVKHLSSGDIYNSLIPLIELKEQIKIAQFLDHQTGLIDAIIKKKEQIIAKLKEQRQAIINEAVTKGLDPNAKMKDSGVKWLGEIPEAWEPKRLKFIFSIEKRISGELGYDVLSVTQYGLKVKDLTNYKGQFSMNYSKYQIVNEGDFVMNHMDLLTGYVDISKQLGVTSPDYRVFELIDKNCNPKYFLYLCQMCYKEKIFYAHGQGVSQLGRWRLQAKEFKNMTFPFPSYEEQSEIVKYIDSKIELIDKLLTETNKSLLKLKSYRQSLISEVVTGKIDVREWEPNSIL